jgi:hypothetical protein
MITVEMAISVTRVQVSYMMPRGAFPAMRA